MSVKPRLSVIRAVRAEAIEMVFICGHADKDRVGMIVPHCEVRLRE